MKQHLPHALRLAAAYLVTALTSGLATSFALSLPRFLNLWQRGEASLEFLLLDAPLICALVTAYSVVPATITIVIAERRRIRRPLYFCLVGAALGALLPIPALGRHVELSVILLGLLLGTLAGLLYWRLATPVSHRIH